MENTLLVRKKQMGIDHAKKVAREKLAGGGLVRSAVRKALEDVLSADITTHHETIAVVDMDL